uniref:Pr1-like protein n=1 Tax=Oryza sativa subsp. japonica TaxID=39947 RepID=Q69X11_ORYSJ|nr:pr1-like protein [Oryza sativa Japonica Group]
MVTAGDHRHGGTATERGEGKGETKRRSTAHPESKATTKTAAGAEEGGGAARVDGVDGVPAVGERSGGADEVGEDAAKPKEAAPGREMVRGDGGGGPELGGDGGERVRRRGLDSDGEERRRVAETVEGKGMTDSKMQKVPGLRDAGARHKPEKERSYRRERERRNGMG